MAHTNVLWLRLQLKVYLHVIKISYFSMIKLYPYKKPFMAKRSFEKL